MPDSLTFKTPHHYDDLKSGIEISATLRFGDEMVLCQAKVDTGAQVCLFKRGIGESLGLVIENGYPMDLDSIGGTFRAYGHLITLQTLGIEVESIVYFAATHNLRRNLLGREGWLQKIQIAVVDYDTLLYVQPYGETS